VDSYVVRPKIDVSILGEKGPQNNPVEHGFLIPVPPGAGQQKSRMT
jgi:hypothetical protein